MGGPEGTCPWKMVCGLRTGWAPEFGAFSKSLVGGGPKLSKGVPTAVCGLRIICSSDRILSSKNAIRENKSFFKDIMESFINAIS